MISQRYSQSVEEDPEKSGLIKEKNSSLQQRCKKLIELYSTKN